MILGRVLHFAWAPIGGTIRNKIVLHSVEAGGTPLWVSLPLLPPAWRELWAEMTMGITRAVTPGKRQHHIGVVLLVILVFLIIAIIGTAAKYGAPHGYLLPGMTT